VNFTLFGVAILACGLLAAQQSGPPAQSYSAADIETGKQNFFMQGCPTCHGADGDAMPNANLRSGHFNHGTSDDDLFQIISKGIPGTPMPPYPSQNPNGPRAIVAYLRSLSNLGASPASSGDAVRGRALFEGKGGCTACHRIGTQGSRTGPNLSSIGIQRTSSDIERSIVDPNAEILVQNRYVEVTTNAGVTITGRRLGEDTFTLQLIDTKENLLSLMKSDLRQIRLLTTSAMPSYKDKLSSAELADLVKYLFGTGTAAPK
jgi:cytochrome c oxidase cbb3-type subunit III